MYRGEIPGFCFGGFRMFFLLRFFAGCDDILRSYTELFCLVVFVLFLLERSGPLLVQCELRVLNGV